jgi:hypothetical protein
MTQHVITVSKDQTTGRYTGTCETVRGLVVEADTIEELVDIAQDLLPDLVAANLAYDMHHGLPPLVQLAQYPESCT